jgi:hypothetical protein
VRLLSLRFHQRRDMRLLIRATGDENALPKVVMSRSTLA